MKYHKHELLLHEYIYVQKSMLLKMREVRSKENLVLLSALPPNNENSEIWIRPTLEINQIIQIIADLN